MKSHDLKKALCQWTAMLALVVSGAVWAANGVDLASRRKYQDLERAIRMPKEQERMPLNHVNQPPTRSPHALKVIR